MSFEMFKEPPKGMNPGAREEALKVPFPDRNVSHPRLRANLKTMFHLKIQSWMAIVGAGVGFYVFAAPTLYEHWADALALNITYKERIRALPNFGPEWWINEWRKGIVPWRAQEINNPRFYDSAFGFVVQATGRKDLFFESEILPFPHGASYPLSVGRAKAIMAALMRGDMTAVRNIMALPSPERTGAEISRAGIAVGEAWEAEEPLEIQRSRLKNPTAPILPAKPTVNLLEGSMSNGHLRALVPLAGDSMISYHLANRGFVVDAVDCSSIAFDNYEVKVRQSDPHDILARRINVFWGDFYSSAVWETLKENIDKQVIRKSEIEGSPYQYDFIYDREGLSATAPHKRDDYAFLIKKAMKDHGGVMYVEGIDRTDRVKSNKTYGPPFELHEPDLKKLFPAEDGYWVTCDVLEPISLKHMPPESLVTRRIPKDLYARPFHCVVVKDVAKATHGGKSAQL